LVIKAKKLKQDGKTTIYVQYTHEAKTLLISTGVKTDPKHWDSKLGKYRRSKDLEGKVQKEALIKKKKNEIEKIAQEIALKGENPTGDEVKSVINKTKLTQKAEEEAKNEIPTFYELFDQFIQQNLSTKPRSTLSVYRCTGRT